MAVRMSWKDPNTRPNGEPGVSILLAALLPLLGGIAYVVLRGTYVRIYSRFGVTPEDVGATSAVVLTGAARILHLGNWTPLEQDWLQLLARIIIFTVLIVAAYLIRFWALNAGQDRRQPQQSAAVRSWRQRIAEWSRGGCKRLGEMPLFNFVMLYLAVLIAATIFVFLISVHRDTDRAITRIRDGVRVRPGNFAFLAVHAYHADVHWIGEPKPPEALTRSATLLYLGRASGQVVFFDYANRHAWRVPESNVLVDLEPGQCGRVEASCPED